MPDIAYLPGTQKSPQQTELSAPAFVDTDHVHFPDGRLTTIPPYAVTSFMDDYVEILGGLRSIFATKLTGTYVGTYYFFATHDRLLVMKNNGLYNMTPLVATKTATLGTDPLAVVDTDATLTVSYTAHGLAVGDRIKLSGATDTGGITAATYINKELIVATVPDANSITVELGDEATSTTSGGGSSVDIFKQITAGNYSQGAAVGYGVGEYGEGIYGQGGPAVTAQFFPRIWSFDNFGNEVAMCPGDYTAGDGQKIYIWDGDTETAPTVLTNAPTDCNWITVVNNHIVALCGNRVDVCENGDGTVWSGATTYSKTLERVWKAVACYKFGEKEAVIFTPQEAILLRYIGDASGTLWDLSDLYTEDGIIAPMSACLVNTVLRWHGARGFYSYDGGPVKREENSQNEEWILKNINYGQAWKSFAMRDQSDNQAWFYFPVGEDTEPGNYVIHNPPNNPNGGHWTLGEMIRTAAQRPGFLDGAFFMGKAVGSASEAAIYRHFTTGAVTFDWYATSSDSYNGDGKNRMQVDRIMPDSNQDGDITLTIYGKEYAQKSANTFGSYTITATTEFITPKAFGRLLAMKWAGSVAFTMGAWKIDVSELGET